MPLILEYTAYGLIFLIFVMSVVSHEVAHGAMAFRLGDDTAYLKGRLTLNPLKHIDPVMTVIVPLALWFGTHGQFVFGGAKPVPVNPYQFKRMRKGMLWTAFMGPATNVLLAGAFASILALTRLPNLGPVMDLFFAKVFGYSVIINLFLAGFNLIPIPPLDGSRILAGIAPIEVARMLDELEKYGFAILIAVIFVLPELGGFDLTHGIFIMIAHIASLMGVDVRAALS